MNIKLYYYQKIAYKKLLSALLETAKALMVMATGLGKTHVSAKIVEYFLSKKPKARILFLCHDTGILERSLKKYEELLGKKYTYARFFGENKNWNADEHTFVFATFQSKPHEFFKTKHFDYIIVDEGHHAKADTYEIVLNFFKPIWKLGMTATPDREDERDIRHMFGKEVVNYSLPEALAKGWLTPLEYKIVTDGLDQDELEAICNEMLVENVRITEAQLNERIFIQKRSEEQCMEILNHTQNGEKAIVFCRNITHLEHLGGILPNSTSLHSGQSQNENQNAMEAFENGKVNHILVVDKFNEGIHIPDVDVLAFLRATNSYRIWLQQLGRALSKFEGKFKVTVLDFVANIERIKNVQKLISEIGEFNPVGMSQNEQLILGTPLHVDGKGFSFDFSSEIVNVLSVLEYMASNEYYSTWQEASIATKKIQINSSTEYLEGGYKVDIKLPPVPSVYYEDFPGWIVFLEKELRPEGWKTCSEISCIKDLHTAEVTIKKFAETFRENNPSWFNNFYNVQGKLLEHYSPELTPLIVQEFQGKKHADKDWLSIKYIAESFNKSIHIIQNIIDNLKPEEFPPSSIRKFMGLNNINVNYYHCSVLSLIQKVLEKREKPVTGWETATSLRKKEDIVISFEGVKSFCDQFRLTNPEWFKEFYVPTNSKGFIEYYHPDLIKKIYESFGKDKRSKAPEGWCTPGVLYRSKKVEAKVLTIKKFAETFRENNPDWFKDYWLQSSFLEHYHPDLVKRVIDNFTSRKNAPDGWKTSHSFRKSKDLIVKIENIEKFSEKFRKEHSEWFHFYLTGNRFVEHYHPHLIDKIYKEFSGREHAPDGWKTPKMLVKELTIGLGQILGIAEKYRVTNKDWFKKYIFITTYSEGYHPDLIKQIKTELLHQLPPPNGWVTYNQIHKKENIGNSHSQIKLIGETFRNEHPEWFNSFWNKGVYAEYYHPDLVQKIKEHFGKK